MARASKDHIETLHDYGLHVPTRTIWVETAVDENGDEVGVGYFMYKKFSKNLHLLENISKDPITVILNTKGGDVTSGMAIYSAIKKSKCHITIKVEGQASSMGCIILQAGDERVVDSWSCIMFHKGTLGAGACQPDETYNSVVFDRELMKKMYDILLGRINEKRVKENKALMAKKTFADMNNEGRYLFAAEAVELGLADRIEE